MYFVFVLHCWKSLTFLNFHSLSAGERPYKCPHCDYAGTQSGSLKYHLQRHHREQRNALSTSSNSSSSGVTSTINSLASGTSGMGKQRRSQLSQHLAKRGSADTPASRPGQQSWLLGVPDPQEHRKALGALRDVDLETQYRYLSGVMGALYQGGMEGGWIRESTPPKAPKVSRRKPLTTSRMVQPPTEKDGPMTSTQEGRFEPLDLSRRTSPGLGGVEENESMGGEEAGGMWGGGTPEGSAGVKLSQCLFCPFHTSSAELMAMHLQVNHTSKSRRKRGGPTLVEEDGVPKPPKKGLSGLDAVWRHMREAQPQTPLGEWPSAHPQTQNGLCEHLEDTPSHPDSMAKVDKIGEEGNDEEEELASLENGSVEDLQEQDLRISPDLSPAVSSIHMVEEEDKVLTD